MFGLTITLSARARAIGCRLKGSIPYDGPALVQILWLHNTLERPVSLSDIRGRVWPEKHASVRRTGPRIMQGFPYSASFTTLHQLDSASDGDSLSHVPEVLCRTFNI